jgi:hypothetical protein
MLVNRERASERLLAVGDVVAIDDYTLTFVVDRDPLDGAVRAVPAAPASGAGNVTALLDATGAAMVEEDLVMTAGEELEPLDAEKELEIVAEAAAEAVLAAGPGAAGEWVVEVVIGADRLPRALAAALAELGRDELRLPAELRLRRR